MGHYLDIHSIDKEIVKGIKVISFCDNEHFEEKMEEVLSVTRCSFNNVFRRYFNVNSEWDCDYFVVKVEHIKYIIEELKHEALKGEESEIYDEDDFNKVMSFLSELSHRPDGDETYLISWDK